MTPERLPAFARDYAAAWCSQDPARVAAFFAEDGSLKINAAPPSVGSAAIAADARSFMSAFPDLHVALDRAVWQDGHALFHWTLTGTHGATGRPVRISGYEQWRFSPAGLIAESLGHFDELDYQRQLAGL